jgi:hypothetical protein
MGTTIDNSEDTIDSRDIIARIEELQEQAKDALNESERKELETLAALAVECEDCSDWEHGAQLVRGTYFVDHTKELISDCYEDVGKAPRGQENRWPYKHVTIDYESAAEELKQDYTEVDFDGVTYFIRD